MIILKVIVAIISPAPLPISLRPSIRYFVDFVPIFSHLTNVVRLIFPRYRKDRVHSDECHEGSGNRSFLSEPNGAP